MAWSHLCKKSPSLAHLSPSAWSVSSPLAGAVNKRRRMAARQQTSLLSTFICVCARLSWPTWSKLKGGHQMSGHKRTTADTHAGRRLLWCTDNTDTHRLTGGELITALRLRLSIRWCWWHRPPKAAARQQTGDCTTKHQLRWRLNWADLSWTEATLIRLRMTETRQARRKERCFLLSLPLLPSSPLPPRFSFNWAMWTSFQELICQWELSNDRLIVKSPKLLHALQEKEEKTENLKISENHFNDKIK